MSEPDQFVLNDEQIKAFEMVKNGLNVFVTGPAGTGKTLFIDEIRDYGLNAKKRVSVTAMTGVAAANVNGSTLHSWAAIGLGKSEPRKHAFYIKKNIPAYERYIKTDILVVDEISMADYEYIKKLDDVAKIVRKNVRKPFGGIQLVFAGDFFQLGPVQKSKETKFLFEDLVWSNIIDKCVHFTKIYRQRNNEFAEMLQKIRVGEVTDEICNKIDSTKNHKLCDKNGVKPTLLFCRNVDVDAINETSIAKIDGEVFVNKSIDYYKDDNYKKLFEKSFKTQPVLKLKIGAQVMLLTNLNVEEGLVNGSRGVVTKFVRAKSEHDVEGCDPAEYTGAVKGVLVKFSNDIFEEIRPYTQECKDEHDSPDDPAKASRIQFPLRLAYALTIHKSQGLSIDSLEIDMRGCFTHGQAYVALSRATSFENLRVRNFSKSCIITSEKVKNFYKDFDKPKKRPRGALEMAFEKNKKVREEKRNII